MVYFIKMLNNIKRKFIYKECIKDIKVKINVSGKVSSFKKKFDYIFLCTNLGYTVNKLFSASSLATDKLSRLPATLLCATTAPNQTSP